MTTKPQRTIITNIALFSVLGIFSYIFIVYYSGMQSFNPGRGTAAALFAATIAIFNIFGFGMVGTSSIMTAKDPQFFTKPKKIIEFYSLAAVALLVMNYALFVILKTIAGSEHPFAVRISGARLIAAIWLIELIVVSLQMLNSSTRNTINLYREKEKLRENMEEARYMALQSQLNPHFLFNSLNTLIAEIEYDPEKAIEFTRKLSEIYRYILQQQNRNTATLGEEMEFSNSYLYLYKVRLGECMEIHCDIPENMLAYRLPPLTLQILLENVFKHNHLSERHPLKVSITADRQKSILSVTNEIRKKENVYGTSTGLKNLSERIRLTSGKNMTVSTDNGLFSVGIPLSKPEPEI